MNRITLSPVMDRNAIDGHLAELKTAFAGDGTIEIGCGQIEQIGLMGLQLLASAIRTGQQRETAISLIDVNAPMAAAITLAGMQSILLNGLSADAGAVA
jgi:ABC-type transporter Mla MlaB component